MIYRICFHVAAAIRRTSLLKVPAARAVALGFAVLGGATTVGAQTSGDATPVCVASTSSSSAHDPDGRDSVARAGFAAAAMECMRGMHEGMSAALESPAASADQLFASAMIPHHQGAIDMSRQLLLFGGDRAMRSLALGIIADQQAEIELLRQWLRRARVDGDAGADGAAVQTGRMDAGLVMRGPRAISDADRVYTADQVSNTVSVIDPSTNRLLGAIRLGNRRPDLLSPLYKGEINVHGLGVSPDGRTLAVVSTGSNAVTLIATATNRVLGTVYVGRSPHEGFFTPDGRELWVAVRGENYVAVIDPRSMRVVRRVVTAPGPSMVVFRPDGRVAFVNHSFTPELAVVDVRRHRVIRRIPLASPFSPDLAVRGDGSDVWLTHKDVGKVSVVNARTFAVEGVIETGPVTNHVNFGGPGGGTRAGGAAAGDFAYVTVGGENAVKVFSRDRKLVATIAVGAVPHGVWPSGDGSRIYVGLQQADSVAVIDTRTNSVAAVVPTGQSPQALLYVAGAVRPGNGSAHLAPSPALAEPAQNVTLTPAAVGAGRATVTIRSLGPVDGVDVSATGLRPSSEYTLVLVTEGADAERFPLATVRSDTTGKANVEAVAPTTIPRAGAGTTRRLVLVAGKSVRDAVVLEGRLPM